jgi:uncharacterized lipoprotein YddW (UPF0748 family)
LFIPLVLAVAGLALPAGAQSRRGEMRGAWMGEGYNRDWPAIMRSLKENGFNALFPSFCTGDLAYYPSKVLPVAKGAAPGRDELAEAIKAAKQHGIELHLWRINWALWGVPPEIIQQLEAAGRLQRNAKGQLGRDDPEVTVDWLCPSNPENRKLEKEAMLEAVRNYDIAGIQFDYMRFPNGNYCFCDHCKGQFQKDTKITVASWPQDVQAGGPYAERWREWRRGLITSLAKEISEEIHRLKPHVYVSLAAWPDLNAAYNEVGQDWPSWVKDGVLDFICPMDYTTSKSDLVKYQLSGQLDRVQGAVPLYAGLGSFLMKSPSQLVEQIQAAREAGADGFVAFAYFSGDLDKWLPDLRATVAGADPNPMPHWTPPTRFSFAGPAAALASGGRVPAGQQLECAVTVGIAPPLDESRMAGEGAAEAATVLRRATEPRHPAGGYEVTPAPAPPLTLGETSRVSGRVVIETPTGLTLGALAAFDGEPGTRRTLRFAAPEGPFRIAVYGTVTTGERKREFVARSLLLVGASGEEQPLQTQATKADLDQIRSQLCSRVQGEVVAGLAAAIQVHATGPGGGDWWMRLKDGKCECGEGEVDSPNLTITASAQDLLAVAREESDPVVLWEAGRITAVGDYSLLRRLAAAFGYGTR